MLEDLREEDMNLGEELIKKDWDVQRQLEENKILESRYT